MLKAFRSFPSGWRQEVKRSLEQIADADADDAHHSLARADTTTTCYLCRYADNLERRNWLDAVTAAAEGGGSAGTCGRDHHSLVTERFVACAALLPEPMLFWTLETFGVTPADIARTNYACFLEVISNGTQESALRLALQYVNDPVRAITSGDFRCLRAACRRNMSDVVLWMCACLKPRETVVLDDETFFGIRRAYAYCLKNMLVQPGNILQSWFHIRVPPKRT